MGVLRVSETCTPSTQSRIPPLFAHPVPTRRTLDRVGSRLQTLRAQLGHQMLLVGLARMGRALSSPVCDKARPVTAPLAA
jgi:hypothetical protein